LINGAGFSLACSLWVLVFGFFLLPVVVFLLITEGRFLARRKKSLPHGLKRINIQVSE
jgi:hypothetical protein